MPYYSVHITGGEDPDNAGREMREMFSGRDADYTVSANFFYVQRPYNLETLHSNIDGALAEEYNVVVKKISRSEFQWRKRGQ